MELSVHNLKSMRPGTVIHRFMTTRNAHRKFIVCKPQRFTKCDICEHTIGDIGIKIEANAGKVMARFCPLCAVDEILDAKEVQ